jgi:hypothetical protein
MKGIYIQGREEHQWVSFWTLLDGNLYEWHVA